MRKTKVKNKLKSQKAITLIALVITIIVLLILAGVTITSITGEKGTIKEARTSKELTEKKALEEQVELAIITAEQKHKNPTLDDVIEELKNNKVISKNDQVDKETGSIITDAGYEITGKLDDYIGKVSIGDGDTSGGDGNTSGGDGNTSGGDGGDSSELPGSIKEIKAGSYVNYIDKSNTTRKCVVLYDESSSYGIQIVTEKSVENVTLGYTRNLNLALASYNSAVSTLNSKANSYLNENFASSARSVGSVPDNPLLEPTTRYTESSTYFTNYNGLYIQGDNNYETDFNQMKNLGILYETNDRYWLASRKSSQTNSTSGSNTSFNIYYVTSANFVSNVCISIFYSDRSVSHIQHTYGLRPVFTLKPEVKITGGTGTKNDPYTLN